MVDALLVILTTSQARDAYLYESAHLCSCAIADYTIDHSCDLIAAFNCRKIWGYRVILVELNIIVVIMYSLSARS